MNRKPVHVPVYAIIHAIVLSAVLAVPLLQAGAAEAASYDERVRKAVVKVFTVSATPSYYNPWVMGSPRSASGSGAIIEGRRILTNAHVVSNTAFLQVQLSGDARRFNAKVLAISHEADLALLGVEDDAFFEGTKPLEFGGLPETMQEVLVYGFPLGGDSLSITKGIISRIEYQEYSHSNYYFLAGQLDAAINPGNSGGPVMQNGRIVGVAMQALRSEQTENLGYMVPMPLIRHFLDDIKDGSYDGFPELGVTVQDMESPALKRKYAVAEDQTGILVTHVFWNSDAKDVVRVGDIIMAIDGHKIADNGTVEFRPGERTIFGYYADLHQGGDEVRLSLLRDGKSLEARFKMIKGNKDYSLVPPFEYDVKPRYFIYGGIVFSPLTKNLLCEWNNCKAPEYLLSEADAHPTEARQEVVLAIQVLPADVNKGNHNLRPWVVREVNGQGFRNFEEFVRLVQKADGQFIVLKNEKQYQIVIDRVEAAASHYDILKTYDVNSDRSAGVQ